MTENIGIAILSTSVALTGLLLVFLGFVLSTYQSYNANTGKSVLLPYRIIALSSIFIFTLSIASAILSLIWLLGVVIVLGSIVPLFIITLLGVLVIGIMSIVMIIFR
jgi:hypothetical protein